ncbi:ABC transporter permease [Xanthobacter dioxanivorans]|uniref:ABC transporter permease n=1 Tax=Xanthobacter dioxanivorans TaxID=2528964 RepID=A0A974SID2_9HYPH|nr:ABC transporter permease [Xanthobacter dioxanivorans]QRG05243.1 ABC transporter permease [Xanthobacter dioxanivorans]
MTFAIMRAMAITLLRDRGALLMTFVLPPLLFILFAAVFAGTGGETSTIKVAAARETDAPAAETFLAALGRAADVALVRATPQAVSGLVADGTVDVGLIVRGDLSGATDKPPLVLLTDPARGVAAAILSARIQRLFTDELPGMAIRRVASQMQVLTGPFTPEQQERLDASVARAPELVAQGGAELMERQPVARLRAEPGVSYYAGAIAMLFLLFSAVQGAASLVDERRSGVFDRIVMSRGGVGALVAGKLGFLVLQGLALAAVLFTVAQVIYGVHVVQHLGTFLAVAAAASAAAAGVALPLAAVARTRQQAQTLSTFAVLLLSAVGGSMVPRFLMPDWLQQLGVLTPTAWGIEAFQDALWRGAGLAALLPGLAVLLGYAVLGGALTLWLIRRQVRLA